MKTTKTFLFLLLLFLITTSGCLERRFFIRWDGYHAPEVALFWTGDSVNIQSGNLPNYDEADWILRSPRKTEDGKEGKFEQHGIWRGHPFGTQKQGMTAPSPITPELSFHHYYLGFIRINQVSGEVPGASFFPFPDPEKGMPDNPVDSLKKAKFPLTAETEEHLDKEHGQIVLKFYRLIVDNMLEHIYDTLYPGDSIKGKKWSEEISDYWYQRLNVEDPASNDIDIFKYLQDTILINSLPPDKVPHALAVCKSLKVVYDTYRELEDEKLVVSLKVRGKQLTSNADSASADTLFWQWDGKKLRSGGPYSISLRTMTFDPVGSLIVTLLLMTIPLYRLSRRRPRRL